MSTPEILEQAENLATDHNPDCLEKDLTQSLRRRLNELVDSGLVRKTDSANKIFYEKISNPLKDLSEEELKIFY